MNAGIPNNGGYFRPIAVKIPSRSVINPELPAPVAARGLTGFRMTNAVLGALAQVVPDKMPACESGGDTGITIAGYYDDDRAFVFLEFLHASWGGRPDKDGIDACSSISANFSNNPIEFLEGDHPLRIEEYSFVADTGGPGQYRGGLALRRKYRFLEREGALQLRTDRQKFLPWGLKGGKPGTPSSNLIVRGGVSEDPPSKAYRILHHGDTLLHTMAGAGGYGNPLERDPSAVAEDVADEKVTLAGAATDYGVVLDPVTLTVNKAETADLRRRLKAQAAAAS